MQNNTSDKRNLLTIGEASEYLGVSIDTLRRWEKRGRIEPYRSPGGHRHFSKDDLDKLFDKKYVRDEPTIRSSSKKEESTEVEKVKVPNIEEVKVETHTPETVSRVIGLPAWRSIEYEELEKDITLSAETPEPVRHVLDRPIREVRIPEPTRIRVTKEEVTLSPNQAYFRQQSMSVLTPAPVLQERQYTSHSPVSPSQPKDLNIKSMIEENNKLVIYGSLSLGLILFLLGWYFLWASSQRVLSPIP